MKKIVILVFIFLSFFCFNLNVRAVEDETGVEIGEFSIPDDYFEDEESEEYDYEDDGSYQDEYTEYEDEPNEQYEDKEEYVGDEPGVIEEEPGSVEEEPETVLNPNNKEIFEENKDEPIKVTKGQAATGKTVSIILIIITLLGFYIGWQRGFVKEVTDFVALFISMVLAGIFKGPLANLLYTVLPFFKLNKLYSVNIILYQVVLYLLLVLLFLGIYQLIIMKLKIKEKIVETSVETNIIFQFLGAALGGPLVVLFLYNVLLFAKLPMFNIGMINNSKYVNMLMEKTPVVSKRNKKLYTTNDYVLKLINNKKLQEVDNEYLDTQIVNYMAENNLVSEKKIKTLYDKGLLKEYDFEVEEG